MNDLVEPAWSRRLASALQAADRRATTLARGLGAAHLNWRPEAGEWSVGQCIEHLHNANETYTRAIAPALAGREAPVDEIRLGGLGGWFIRHYIDAVPDTKRAQAPKKIKPGAQVDVSILERFLESNGRVRDLMRRAAHYDVNRIRFPNPYVPILRFTVGTGFEVLTRHQNRHLAQAERIRSAPGFPEG